MQHDLILRSLRGKIVKACQRAQEGHIPSSLSILDLLWFIYSNLIKDRGNLKNRFVLSKGHAALGLFSVLDELGFLEPGEFDSYGNFDSNLGGHADRNKVSFVEASTGSLGHGMPIAIGLAMGKKIRRESGDVYVLIGDGECNEGTIWESCLLGAHHNLDNLCCIIDNNNSSSKAINLDSLLVKFNSFNWNTVEIDGHDPLDIARGINFFHGNRGKGVPTCIVAKTIKGRGIASVEQNPAAWHHKQPSKEEAEQLLGEINAWK
jgi:transketolase